MPPIFAAFTDWLSSVPWRIFGLFALGLAHLVAESIHNSFPPLVFVK